MRRASDWLEEMCLQQDVPRAQVDRLVLCLNEALANVIDHGGDTAISAPIRVTLEIACAGGGGTAAVTVSDAGAAFDPLSVATTPRPTTLDEASAGGLGLVMIRRCSDWTGYRHADGRNHLIFGARWSAR